MSLLWGLKTPGRRAYEAYCKAFPGEAGRIAVDNWPWEKLPQYQRDAWEVAAKAGSGR